ncbi:tRNA (adenosine(37)-N6)-dimethylallyltransferase MiaA [Alkanindiges sp. WGS2144]|uniref:tRNA (adenosine(37)-N6)-dimethylallyltransferase MiaA n=1 Tax=Alkanindiges sp. WGS2144 TaxID=3366808 RepID=UPI00374FED92
MSTISAKKSELPVICLMGPTASGKTALACELFETGRFELVSVDSALVYQDMNIGTAKPSPAELAQYPHFLVDIIDPTQVYSAAQFVEDVTQLVDSIHARGKVPLLVGGTMLYFRSLIMGMADNLPAADPLVREQIEQRARIKGWQSIHDELKQVDPRAAIRFKPADHQRVTRALEVYYLTGRAISDLHDEQQNQLNPDYHFELHALMPDRLWLHQRIAERLDIMWKIGFLDEVIELRKKYQLHESLPSMRAVGYRQVWEFLENGGKTAQELHNMQEKALFATRQLAKRQYTWLRSLRELHVFNIYNTVNEGILDLRIRYR